MSLIGDTSLYNHLNIYQKDRVDYLSTLGKVQIVDLGTPEGAWVHFEPYESYPFLNTRSWFSDNGFFLLSKDDSGIFSITIPEKQPILPFDVFSIIKKYPIIVIAVLLIIVYLIFFK
jgi:hypothetical protein